MTAQNRVLVVEDEQVIRTALRRLLERHDYVVEEAGSVRDALENFNPDDFDIVISDLRLPGAPGTDLISSTKTPVLIMTSYSSLRSAIDSMKMPLSITSPSRLNTKRCWKPSHAWSRKVLAAKPQSRSRCPRQSLQFMA